MSTFEEAWSGNTGDVITVANGQYEPFVATSNAHKIWRSNNFTGALVEKLDATETRPRRLRIRYGEASTCYDVPEGQGHVFTLP